MTVFLELVWLLKSSGFEREDIAAAVRALLGLDEIKPREPAALADALQWYEAGLDFPDALHLALSRADEALLTFDNRFARRAVREGAAPPVVLA